MVFSNQHLLGVTTFLLGFLVKGVDCWTDTHSFVAVGSGTSIMLIYVCIRCCVRYSTMTEERRRRPARDMVIVRTATQHRPVDTSSNPTDPYNAGYDQTGKTLSNPPTYDQIARPPTTGNPSSPDPYNTGYDQSRYM
ncbi:uncharacterized protein LOC117329401 [Pecten maximus]|uniref:uncharacterized protein LOC117329401 n=1 Tax=Pecten maximus TaxID=6579 RepID=UPI001458771A|nr:uncharacterized protein LOC117329401 [Pecten maximus]